MSSRIDESLRIALVGNGPVAEAADRVDDHDLVVRFNRCTSYAGCSGRRVDVLCIVNTGLPGAEFAENASAIDQTALREARRFWLPKAPDLVARYASTPKGHLWKDYSAEIVERRLAGRPWEFLPPQTFDDAQAALRAHGADVESEPSTGMLVLFHLRRDFPSSKVTLFGFTHQGWRGHPWDAERRLIASWNDWVSYAARAE